MHKHNRKVSAWLKRISKAPYQIDSFLSVLIWPAKKTRNIFAKIFYMKLFVAGFPFDFDDADLKDMFELYGTVSSAKFVTDRNTGKSKGFGFIEMPDNTEAMETMQLLNGTKMKGKQISVQKAEEGQRSNSRPGNSYNKRY